MTSIDLNVRMINESGFVASLRHFVFISHIFCEIQFPRCTEIAIITNPKWENPNMTISCKTSKNNFNNRTYRNVSIDSLMAIRISDVNKIKFHEW